jgi:anti-repressor protein
MESSIQIFNNPSFGEVRVTEVNGEPFFCLADVCKALDINNVSQCKTRLTEKGVIINDTLTKGGTQKMTFINESNLYKCIFQSRRPDAEKFQDWVFDEVLPSIRKHGAYMTSETLEKALLSPDYLIKLANILKEEKQKRIEAEKQNEILKPKAELMDKILDSDQRIDIGQATKILGLPFGRNTLFKKLRDNGIFFKNRNEPKQIFIEKGLFLLKEKWIERDNHDGFTVIKVLVTQKGLDYLSKLFCTKEEKQQMAMFK